MKYFTLTIMLSLIIGGVEVEQLFGQAPVGKVYTYKKSGGKERQMEIYFPEGHDPKAASVPGVIMFHGGGWGGGNRKQFRNLCHYFASRGLVTATASYKLAEKKYQGEGSRKRDCIIDAKSAIRWFKENAEELGVDPSRIIGGGGSAGGHICMLATTNPGLNDPADNQNFDTSVVAYLLFNPAFANADSKDAEVYLPRHLKSGFSPSIVFFGSEDEKWLKGWKPVYKKIKAKGIENMEYWFADGQGHGFFNNKPWSNLTLAASDRFLKKHGLIEGEPTLKPPASGKKLTKK